MQLSYLKFGFVVATGIAGFAMGGFAPPQSLIWEKTVAPGLTYHMEVDRQTPRVIHVVRFAATSPVVTIRPELAGKTVYEGSNKGMSRVTDIVKEQNALGAINADFFPFTGDPLGLMVRQGELMSIPNEKRSTFGWGPNFSSFSTSNFSGQVLTEGGEPIKIDGLNEDCGDNRVVLNTPDAGISKTNFGCATAILRVDGSRLSPSTDVPATVVGMVNDGANMPLTPGQFTLVGTGSRMTEVRSLKQGQRVKVKVSTTGFDWLKVENAISGGPNLLRGGNLFIDYEAQGFGADFATKRHPRTAIGRTAEGDMLFVVIDGRQPQSVGATLAETAEIMQRLDCKDAINLDGGGSSSMNLFGLRMNRPSDKTGERPIANGVAFYGPRQPANDSRLKIQSAGDVKIGGTRILKVTDAEGREIPNAEVFWSATGGAWIDQGGQLEGIEAGEVRVWAYVRGVTLDATMNVK